MNLARRGIGGVLVACAAVACAGAPAASAAKYDLTAEIPGPGDLRYAIEVKDDAAGFGVVKKDPGSLSIAAYRSKGLHGSLRPSGDVDADLGAHGFVRGRFVESRPAPRPRDRCQHSYVREGFFVGRISLRGIPGVPAVQVHRVPATLTKSNRVVCPEIPHPRASDVSLIACNRTTGTFYATGDSGLEKAGTVLHYATRIEKPSRDLTVFRYVLRRAKARTFDVAPDLLTATVRAPSPFTGTGSFSDGKLSGDLAVQFVGVRAPVAIAPGPALIDPGDSETDLDPPCHVRGLAASGGSIAIAGRFMAPRWLGSTEGSSR